MEFTPYKTDTVLTGYCPVPRELLNLGLPSTAVLLYAVLLDRATLSQKNHYSDEFGRVYVIFTIENLAEALHISDTAVKRHLRELEEKGLIRRSRESKNGPSHIYLNLPPGSCKETKGAVTGPKKPPSTGRKVPTNNQNKQQKKINYYQHREDESL